MKEFKIAFLLFTFMGFTKIGFTKDYNCELNLIPRGEKVDLKKADAYIKRSIFNASKEGVGKLLQVGKVTAKIWKKNNLVHLLIEEENSSKVQTSFQSSQNDIKLKLNENIDFSCLAGVKNNSDDVSTQNKDHISLDDDLKIFTKDIRFIVEKSWRIVWEQINSNDMMRLSIFQKARNYTADESYDQNSPHCRFNARLKRQEDVYVPKYGEFKVMQVNLNDYNQDLQILSYSFVDPSTAQIEDETSQLIPFNFECIIKKNVPFTYRNFRDLVGKRIQLELLK